MASRAKFPVYRGDQPFVFISYAHADSERVLALAEELHRRKYRVWYDEGIEAGMKWPEYIATHLLKAGLVMFFPSEHFNVSHNCEREVNFSTDMKKPMVSVPLDAAELPPGLKMQLSTATSFPAGDDAAATVERIVSSGALDPCLIGDGVEGYAVETGRAKRRFNTALFFGIAGVTLALGFGIALLGYMRGLFGAKSGLQTNSVTITQSDNTAAEVTADVTNWSSPVSRDLFLSQVSGNAIYCCGKSFVSTRSAIDYRDGAFLVAGTPAERGDISDLSVIVNHTDLVELSLCYESITDASALSGLIGLTYLDLSGNEVDDISALSALPALTVLKLSHTNVSDLAPLLGSHSLRQLYVSYDMIGSIQSVLSGDFDVIVTE